MLISVKQGKPKIMHLCLLNLLSIGSVMSPLTINMLIELIIAERRNSATQSPSERNVCAAAAARIARAKVEFQIGRLFAWEHASDQQCYATLWQSAFASVSIVGLLFRF
jgi:hypothetical protein